MPVNWVPAYLAFFRIANAGLQIAANYHCPRYLKMSLQPDDAHGTRRPKVVRGLLFAARESYIRDTTPFLETAEQAFNAEFVAQQNIQYIGPKDAEIRKLLYNMPSLNGSRLEQCSTHLWSRALHLTGKVRWSYPCLRCQFLHKSMDNYEPEGLKAVVWRKEYAPLNCGEPLAIAMVFKYERDGGKMYA